MPTCSGSLRRPPRGAPALPALSRANHVRSRLLLPSHMVTWVGEHCVGFHNGFVGRGADVPLQPVSAGLFRRKSTGVVVQPAYLEFAFRHYWHYDVLRALDYFRRSGAAPEPRMAEAVAVVQSKRQPDGR
jgi:hypothetical protein